MNSGHDLTKNIPTVFWTGTLSLPLKLVVNSNCLLAWITGNTRNTSAMKQRMRDGYSGSFSDHVTHYDEVGLEHYTKIAENLLAGIDVQGKKVLDVGCGTGILSLINLEKCASKLILTEISARMLNQCRAKIDAK